MKHSTTKILLLLLLGAFFLFFSNGRWNFALAGWLFPVFLLQVSRKEKAMYSYLIIPIITAVCNQLSFWKFSYGNPDNILFYIPAIFGIFTGLLFYFDRLLYHKIQNFSATLVFPLLFTSYEFLNNLPNPFGSTGALPYSQYSFLSLAQLASITGIWGITFMVTWFGSVIYWIFENYRYKEKVLQGLIIYSAVFITIIVYGSIRLIMPLQQGTVSTAGIHVYDRESEGSELWNLLDRKDTIAFKQKSDKIFQRLINTTVRQAQTGVKIILWSELSPNILKSKEDSVLSVIRNVARQQKIYLIATPFVNSIGKGKSENKAIIFNPEGEAVLTHYKFGGNFLEGTKEGDKNIKTIATPHGNLSAVVCWDADFPATIKQSGILHTDILFIPSSDWKEIDPLHTTVAIFRAVENGCSVVRQTQAGLSVMADPRGKIITSMDHYTSSSWIMNGQVPVKGWFTLYPIIGDFFAWLSVAALAYLITKSMKNAKQSNLVKKTGIVRNKEF